MIKDEALMVSSFFCVRNCSLGLLSRLLPSKIFKKKFFRVGVWGGFEWVGGIGNSGFVVGVVLGVI